MSRPRVDTGKFGKEMKALKPRDARKLDKELRVPPHKKVRTYVLAIEWTETTVRREEHRFHTKQAREDAEKRLRRELARDNRSYDHYSNWRGSRVKYQNKVGPILAEYTEDGDTTETTGDAR